MNIAAAAFGALLLAAGIVAGFTVGLCFNVSRHVHRELRDHYGITITRNPRRPGTP